MTADGAIRLLIADDHTMVRIGLREMISRSPRMKMTVVAEAADGREAVALFRQHRPDVAILDVRMPCRSGIDAIGAIRTEFPSARLIALGNDDDDVYRAIRAGARAYLFKNVGTEDLIQTIEAVHAGRGCLTADVADRLVEQVGAPCLTPREMEVLEQLARGASNAKVASRLGISTETVKVHVKHILDKLDAENRSQAVSTALQNGIVHLD